MERGLTETWVNNDNDDNDDNEGFFAEFYLTDIFFLRNNNFDEEKKDHWY